MKVYVTTKKYAGWMIGICLVLCAILILNAGHVKDIVSAAAPKKDLPIYNVDRPEKIVAMSFDAAWDEINK